MTSLWTALCVTSLLVVFAPAPATAQDAIPLEFPGGIVWDRTLAAPTAAPPAFDQRRAYLPLRDGTLLALSLLSGETDWTAARKAVFKPVVVAGLIIGIDGQTVWALDTADGRDRWQQTVPPGIAAAPDASDTVIVVAGANGQLVAMRVADGSALWTAALDAPHAAAPLIGGGHVYAGLADGRVVCLSLEAGHVVWTRRIGGEVRALSYADGRLYAGSTDNFLYAIAARNGSQDWRWRTGGDVTEPAVSDDRRVYFVSMDNTVRALNRHGGNLVWQASLGSRPAGAPLLVDGRVIVAGIGPEIRAFVPKDGTINGRFALEGRLGHTPGYAARDGDVPARLIVATGLGRVFAIGGNMERAAELPANVPGVLVTPRLTVSASDILPVDGTVETSLVRLESPPGRPVPGALEARGGAGDGVLPAAPELLRGSIGATPGVPAAPRLLGSPLLELDGAVEPPTGPLDWLPGTLLTPERAG